jgi:hypothetical protein
MPAGNCHNAQPAPFFVLPENAGQPCREIAVKPFRDLQA